MGLTYVGGKTAAIAGSTSTNTTVALSSGLTGGIGSAVQAGDLVVVVFGVGSTADRSLSIKDSAGGTDYTLIGSELYINGTTYDANLRAAYKFMPGTPDANVVLGPTGAAADGGAYAIHVWRGVDPTTPLDGVSPATATGTGTSRPNPPAITPSSSGAKVLVATCGAASTGTTAFTFASANNLIQSNRAATNDGRASLASYDWTSGSLDPAAAGAGSNNAADSWAAISFVLKPDPSIVDPPAVVNSVATSNLTTNAYALTLPGSRTVGNVLVAVITHYDNSSASISAPAGWTEIGSKAMQSSGNVTMQQSFYRVIDGSESSPVTFNNSQNVYHVGVCIQFSGVDTSNPLDGTPTGNNGSGTTRTGLGITTSVANSLLVLASAGYGGSPSSTPAGMASVISFDGVNAVYSETRATAGATSDRTFTQSASDSWTTKMFALRATSAGGSHSLTATGISSSPAVGSPAISQNHSLTASGVAPTAPSVGSPALGQVHALTATGIAAGVPSVGSPALTQVVALTASGIANGAPSVGAPAIGQVHALTAQGIGPTAPSVGAPALAQVHALTATGISSSPIVGGPAITQLHALSVVAIAAGIPSVGSPAIAQVHNLTAVGISTGPTVGSPTLSEAGAVIANGVTTSPAVGSPALGQNHVLTATGISAGPLVGSPALSQNYALAATGIAAGTPSVGSPAVGQVHALAALGPLASPAVGSPALGQRHALTALGIATAAPAVGSPMLGNGFALTATAVTVAPTVGAPGLAQVHNLTAVGIGVGVPSVGTPALGQVHALAAAGLATAAPGGGSPSLAQGHVLAAVGISTGAPALGLPALDLVLSISLDRLVALQAVSRVIVLDAPLDREIALPAVLRSILLPPQQE